MKVWTCFLDPFNEKQLVRDDYTREEHWVDTENLLNALSYFHKEKGVMGIWIEGAYEDAYDLIFKFHNAYPNDDLIFTVN